MTEVILHTDGKTGLWSKRAAEVRIVDMELGKGFEWEKGEIVGELRVYFDRKTWDTEKHGLIYTDDRFLRELRKFLNQHGLPGKDVDYSEQGMQGRNYVSLDAGSKFYAAWTKKFNVPLEKMIECF